MGELIQNGGKALDELRKRFSLPKPKTMDIDCGLGTIPTEIYEAKDVDRILLILKTVQDENESLRKMQGMTLFEVIDSRITELQNKVKELSEENKMLKKVTEAR